MPSPREKRLNLPNLLTAVRLGLLPFLWAAALAGQSKWVGLGLIVSAVSDYLDGLAARRLGRQTAFGSQLDSIADGLVFASVLFWVPLLQPELLRENMLLLGAALLLNAVSLALGWIKFHRFGDLHLYSSKVASLFAYVFLVHAFLFGYNRFFLHVASLFYILASLEALLIQVFNNSVDEHMGSLLGPWLRRD